MTEVKLYKTTLKGLKIFAYTIPFVAIGIWMISKEPNWTTYNIIGWLCASFFGLSILVGLFHILDRRPQIIINENGVWDRTTNQKEVKWEQIQDVYPLEIYGQIYVSIIVDNSFIFKPKPYKWTSKINSSIGAQDFNLYVGQLKIDENKMTAFIKEMIKTEKENRQKVIKKYFDQ